MTRYLVERYLPGVTEQELAEAISRLRAAAAALAECGEPVRHLGSAFVPEEESCFCQFEAASAAAVARASELARLPFARITEAQRFPEEREEPCELSH